eukprot:TRINITY_DN12745_c0_g1_i3.p1 TRINITY_DN12745_c0_g1~~TRINITY_DN12745_c0_g1_i3.p1  ORF type:complete len:460 (-),score=172.09 TRINITY_DN12745_c0_g1_i3:86-1339(-)
MADHASYVLAQLRQTQREKFYEDVKRARGVRALLELLKDPQPVVLRRASLILAEMCEMELLRREVLEADGVTALTRTLVYLDYDDVIQNCVKALSSLYKLDPSITQHYFARAQGAIMISQVMAKSPVGDFAAQCVQLLHVVSSERSSQDVIRIHGALFRLLELCHHPDDHVKALCFQALTNLCKDNEINKAQLREREAMPMLATFLTTPHYSSALKRLALRTALEIGFICDSSPFWAHLSDLLSIRESEQQNQQERQQERQQIEEAKEKKEAELRALRMDNFQLKQDNETLSSKLETRSFEVERLHTERTEMTLRIAELERANQVLAQKQADLNQNMAVQTAQLQAHVRTLDEQLRKAQSELTVSQATLKEIHAQQPQVEEMHYYLDKLADFCRIPKFTKKGKKTMISNTSSSSSSS